MKKILALSLLTTTAANALPISDDQSTTTPLTIGISGGYKTGGYDAKAPISALPYVFYDDDRTYIEGAEAGLYAKKSKTDHTRFGLSFDGQSFDPKHASAQLSTLDKRTASTQAHLSHLHITPIGGIRLKVAHDINNERGTKATLSHLTRFKRQNTTIYPQVGVDWHSEEYNRYYYGVSAQEAEKSALLSYSPTGGVSPFVSVTANHQFSEHLSILVNGRVQWLSSAQKQSPMTNSDQSVSLRVGVGYRF